MIIENKLIIIFNIKNEENIKSNIMENKLFEIKKGKRTIRTSDVIAFKQEYLTSSRNANAVEIITNNGSFFKTNSLHFAEYVFFAIDFNWIEWIKITIK